MKLRIQMFERNRFMTGMDRRITCIKNQTIRHQNTKKKKKQRKKLCDNCNIKKSITFVNNNKL
jgi:hypothetical protein